MEDQRTSLLEIIDEEQINIYDTSRENHYFIIKGEAARGGSSIIYYAEECYGSNHRGSVLLKECYPNVDGIIRDENRTIVNRKCASQLFPDEENDKLKKIKEAIQYEYENGQIIAQKMDWVAPVEQWFEDTCANTYGVMKRNTFQTVLSDFISNDNDAVQNINLRAWVELFRILTQVVQSMHSADMLHLDISPGNVVLSAPENTIYNCVSSYSEAGNARLHYDVKLIDFGCSLRLVYQGFNCKLTVPRKNSPTTERFSAPELKDKSERPFSTESDVYSICALFKYCIERCNIAISDYPAPVSAKIDEILDIKNGGLAIDNTNRIRSAPDLLNHFDELLSRIDNSGITRSSIWTGMQREYQRILQERFGRNSLGENIIESIISYAKVETGESATLSEPEPLMGIINRSVEKSEKLYLYGEGGVGKTTALLRLLQETYIEDAAYDKNAILPIYIPLNRLPDIAKSYVDRGEPVRDWILRWIAHLATGYESRNILDKDVEITRLLLKNEPKIVLLLDGLNEVSNAVASSNESSYAIITKELEKLLDTDVSLGVIITSRSQFTGFIEDIKTVKLLGITDSAVEEYLKSKGFAEKVESIRNNQGLFDCLHIPLFLLMYSKLSVTTDVCTRGEILREFWSSTASNMYNQNTVFGLQDHAISKPMYRFVIDYIVPEIAYHMICKKSFQLKLSKFEGIINQTLIHDKSDIYGLLGNYGIDVFSTDDATVKSIANRLLRITDPEDAITNTLVGLGLLIKDFNDNTFEFTHQYYRDYFAAVWVANQLKLAVEIFNDTDAENPDASKNAAREKLAFLRKPLNREILLLLGEYLGEAQNKPYFENDGWHYGVPKDKCDRNLLSRSLDLFRGRFEGEDGYCINNLIEVLKLVRSDLSGENFSNLNLDGISFQYIQCSRICQKSICANFSGSLITRSFDPPPIVGTIISMFFCDLLFSYVTARGDIATFEDKTESVQGFANLKSIIKTGYDVDCAKYIDIDNVVLLTSDSTKESKSQAHFTLILVNIRNDSRKIIATFPSSCTPCFCVDGNIIWFSDGTTLKEYRISTNSTKEIYNSPNCSKINSIDFYCKSIIIATDKGLDLLCLSTHKICAINDTRVSHVKVCDKFIVCINEYRIKIFNIALMKFEQFDNILTGTFRNATLGKNGIIYIATGLSKMYLIDTETWQMKCIQLANYGRICDLYFRTEVNDILVGGELGQIIGFNSCKFFMPYFKFGLQSAQSMPKMYKSLDKNCVLIPTWDGCVREIDTTNKKAIRSFRIASMQNTTSITDIAVDSEAKIIFAGSLKGNIYCFDYKSGHQTKQWDVFSERVAEIVINKHTGIVAAASWDGSLCLISTNNFCPKKHVVSKEYRLYAIDINPSGSRIAVMSKKSICGSELGCLYVFDVDTTNNNELVLFEEFDLPVSYCIRFLDDDNISFGTKEGKVGIIAINKNKTDYLDNCHLTTVISITVDNNMIFSMGMDRAIKIYCKDSLCFLKELSGETGHSRGVTSVVLMENGLFSSGNDARIICWSQEIGSTNTANFPNNYRGGVIWENQSFLNVEGCDFSTIQDSDNIVSQIGKYINIITD